MRPSFSLLIALSVACVPMRTLGQALELRASTVDGGGSEPTTAGSVTLRGTTGQPDAGSHSSSSLSLRGGFWPQVLSTEEAAATPTATSAEPTPSATITPIATATRTASEIPTATATATETLLPTVGATSTHTATATMAPDTPPPSPSPTETLVPDVLLGDANCDDQVNAADVPALIRSIVDGETAECGRDDVDRNQTIDEVDLEKLPQQIFSR